MTEEKKLEDTIKELEPQFRALKAIFENPEARREYERKIQAEASERKAKEISWLDEQRKKIEHVDAAVGLQEKVYDLARQMGLDPNDFKQRLDKGEFDNLLFYSGLKEHVPFFETKLKEKTQKKSEFERKGMDVHLKYLKEGISDLKSLLSSLKWSYDPKKNYEELWIEASCDHDLGIEKISEIYLNIAKLRNEKPKIMFPGIFKDYQGESPNEVAHWFGECILARKFLPEFEISLKQLELERENNENKSIFVSVQKKKIPWRTFSGYISVKDLYNKSSSYFWADNIHNDCEKGEYHTDRYLVIKYAQEKISEILGAESIYGIQPEGFYEFKTEKFENVLIKQLQLNKKINDLHNLLDRLVNGLSLNLPKGVYMRDMLKDAGIDQESAGRLIFI